MPVNKNEITKEMIAKALQSKSAEELMALAKSKGIELTKDEAEAYMAELADVELDGREMKNVAGGPENLLGGKSVLENGRGRPNHAGTVRDPSFSCHRESYCPCDVQTGILEFVIV